MSTNRENGSLYTKVNNKVARVEFGHPASNSFVSELLGRLSAEITKLSGREDVSLI
ncbi:MAG: enoyl-CoA hydratase/isomerase family protein, partial [Flavobacteriaceae bacterium]|nr:enoyl-CoA hydratase/isomerase family protein [Flavobacteriaceae bacterium]